MFADTSIDMKYEETFQLVYGQLNHSKQNDPKYTRLDLKRFLESLYDNQGNNWLGRSEVQEAVQAATIAAAELLLSQWE
ncbi:hypothetical protein [Petrocella sp. FN5]|uniref:hypothetical protein n=1 Tax=Petrocella sp. FN5 TaxID=3032002 RepID=UPI0023DAD9B9|nr:hypothetical protein [Petrocella sp. FN5]MDF1617088.1 hypothetical protein [Petrocella sp. FN5]